MILEQEKGKMVVFGAGKIGRSFIGAIFSKGGYEVVFIDKDVELIRQLNTRNSYHIIQKSDELEERITINQVRGIHSEDKDRIVKELVSADICTVSVGMASIRFILPVLAEALSERYRKMGLHPLDIIIAENMAEGDKFMLKGLQEHLPEGFPLDAMTGLIETSIGKMVPVMHDEDLAVDPLVLYAEPYNTLILSKKGFKGPVPDMEGLEPKENIKAWVDRKRFIHNLGHAAVAYPAYLFNPALKYIWEALEVHEIFNFARRTMLQSARILLNRYPDEFTEKDLEAHIDDLLYRFRNKALGDTIFRVGCDLPRKLGANDRLAGAIHLGTEAGLNIDKILFTLVCGIWFRASGENGQVLPGDSLFLKEYEGDIAKLIVNVCGFNKEVHHKIIELAEYYCNGIKQGRFSLLIGTI